VVKSRLGAEVNMSPDLHNAHTALVWLIRRHSLKQQASGKMLADGLARPRDNVIVGPWRRPPRIWLWVGA
jgi:hypothetical protein